MKRRLRMLAALCTVFAMLLLTSTADAQLRRGGIAGGVRMEARTDVRWSGAPDVQGMLGGALPLDRAVRLAFLAGAGVERNHTGNHASITGEVHARVLLDPLAARDYGWYAVAGMGYRAAESHSPRAYLVMLGGVEGPRILGGRARLAMEAGVGDGVRLGIVLRAARPGAR